MYGDVTQCMMMWHYVWWCDTDDVSSYQNWIDPLLVAAQIAEPATQAKGTLSHRRSVACTGWRASPNHSATASSFGVLLFLQQKVAIALRSWLRRDVPGINSRKISALAEFVNNISLGHRLLRISGTWRWSCPLAEDELCFDRLSRSARVSGTGRLSCPFADIGVCAFFVERICVDSNSWKSVESGLVLSSDLRVLALSDLVCDEFVCVCVCVCTCVCVCVCVRVCNVCKYVYT